jgi:hypothetical protein
MSTGTPTQSRTLSELTDLELLQRWVGKRLRDGHRDQPLGEALDQFHEQLAGLRVQVTELAEAVASADRGECVPWDAEAIMEEARRTLAAKGITVP